MKKTFICLFIFSTIGFSQVQFTRLTLDSAEVLAGSQNKNIMIDYYTDWCVPCKELEKYVFDDSAISGFINQHYVSVKVNAESRYGNIVGEKLELQKAYPTVIFLKSSGKEIDRIVGTLNPDDYFQRIKDFTKGVNTLSDLMKRDKANAADTLKYQIGIRLTERGKFNDAIGYFQQLVKSKNYNSEGAIYFQLGILYALTNDIGKAKEYADKAIDKDPNEQHYREFLQKLNSQ
jgi:tetratricopeptide (TPR) repeat protein